MESQVIAGESVQVVEQLPVDPVGALAPPISGVVVDLRDGWLADVEASPEIHKPKKVTWYVKLWREFKLLRNDMAFWGDCAKELAIRATPPKKRRQMSAGRVRRGDAARGIGVGRILTATFALAFGVGLLLYVATVLNILNPHQLGEILKR
jgi:hypothetical protein